MIQRTALALLGWLEIVSSQAVFVPLDHQVYPLLVKGETLGLLDSYALRVLPLTRTEILRLLSDLQRHTSELSQADAALTEQLLGEFTDPAPGEDASETAERHLLRFEEGSTQIFLDSRVVQEGRWSRGRVGIEDETVSETSAHGLLRARFGEHVVVGASARSSMTLGGNDLDSRFEPTGGKTQVVVGRSAFSDQATGYVGVTFGKLQLHFGRSYIAWGSGWDEQLGLSSRNEPMDMLRLSLDFNRVRFSYFHATLEGLSRQRYLVGHRLDVLLGRRFQVGFYETLVYAGRGIEWGYLNPFVPYHFMEHQLGDLDNNTVGLDVSATLTQGVRFFGELFVDDLNWNRSITGHWGNKLAYLAGVRWAAPFDLKTVELVASYTRVDPWVYTHTDSSNVYSHRGESIGSRVGPNGERLSCSIAWRPDRNWWLEFLVESGKKGNGDLWTAHRTADGERKRFLEGIVEDAVTYSGRVRYQFFRDFFAAVEWASTKRSNALQVAGLSSYEKFLRLIVEINY